MIHCGISFEWKVFASILQPEFVISLCCRFYLPHLGRHFLFVANIVQNRKKIPLQSGFTREKHTQTPPPKLTRFFVTFWPLHYPAPDETLPGDYYTFQLLGNYIYSNMNTKQQNNTGCREERIKMPFSRSKHNAWLTTHSIYRVIHWAVPLGGAGVIGRLIKWLSHMTHVLYCDY